MKRILLIAAVAWLCASNAASAQAPIDSIMAYLQHATLFSRATPQEKVYLHFDNTGYFKGERMWFKAYVTRSAISGQGVTRYIPTSISKVLYVELLNPSGDVIDKRKLKIENGEAQGDFLLDSIYGNGFYEVRAFTRYMMNFAGTTDEEGNTVRSAAGCFSRVFPIYEKPKQEGDYSEPYLDDESTKKRQPDQRSDATTAVGETTAQGKGGSSVKFFPEGGDLVLGLTSKVAYMVSGGDAGSVERGVVEVTPTGGEIPFTYKDAQGKERTVNFPAPKADGCVLSMDVLGDEMLTATVQTSQGMQGKMLAYVLMHNGMIVQCDTFSAPATYVLELQRDAMPAGVNQLTVFDTKGEILCERLFFICPSSAEADSISVRPKQGMELKPCGLVSLTLQTQPNSRLSFAALDPATMTNGKEGNINTWMLLASDVKGYIDNPEYYFEADDAQHREAADLLMLTQGWRRYDWRLIEGVEPFVQPIQPIEDKLYIFGQLSPSLSKWKKKNPVNDVELTAFLYNTGGAHLKGETITDSLGNYAFELPDIEGEWNLQIQTRIDDKLKTYTVGIDRHFSPLARTLDYEETQLLDANEANLFRRPKQTAQAGGAEGDEEYEEYVKNGQYQLQIGDRSYITKTVKIKAKRRYWTDYSGGWYNEGTAQRHASFYYDCDEASDTYADLGESQPTVYEWLGEVNSLFEGGDMMMDYYDHFIMANTNTTDIITDDTLPGEFNIHRDGPNYNGRPIVWILNNKYAGATSVAWARYRGEAETYAYLQLTGMSQVRITNNDEMPTFLDEVKSIYVSEDPNVMSTYLMQSDIQGHNPVIIFVYTHPTYSTASNKGLRKTHFQGFNAPTTFETEDYSILPPMDDFRRTLWWEPNVQTDDNGEATVEFYNNSSANELFLSIEGMTPYGTFVAK